MTPGVALIAAGVRAIVWNRATATALALIAAAGAGFWVASRGADHRASTAELRASHAEGEADAARRDQAQAAEQARQAKAEAEQARVEVQGLRSRMDRLPKDPGPRPVPADASLVAVADGLASLGVRPGVCLEGLTFSLPQSRTVLEWGREARRVEPLAARLATCTDLATAQEGEINALRRLTEAQTKGLQACSDRSEALQKQASALRDALEAEKRRANVLTWKTRLKWGGIAVGAAGLGYLLGKR